ncbi:MAG: tRNA-specific adenosine deaminase [Gammaproteobacteria bacterium RIFCSPHIGHO2_12_FULL_37_14]|nr:MAG: tRNA-specific adenosine deaminase [Gammaproteobacteria bacterium RIFCSPHIGHO2_12_FULL_37_14]
MFSEQDKIFMQRAIELAQQAAAHHEVPIGALLVLDNEIIAEGYNCPISQHDPCAHAEIIALRHASRKLANYRLINTALYVTLEPCMMCAGAMVHARIKRLVYGAADPKAGAIVSKAHCLDQPFLNHHVEYSGGLLAEQCGSLLSLFFQAKRG